jgi:hypothetical protein
MLHLSLNKQFIERIELHLELRTDEKNGLHVICIVHYSRLQKVRNYFMVPISPLREETILKHQLKHQTRFHNSRLPFSACFHCQQIESEIRKIHIFATVIFR